MDVPWKTTIYDAKQIYAKKLIEKMLLIQMDV